MKIALLEWICGGGLATGNDETLFHALRDEGWAMLQCLVRELSKAGQSVSIALDDRLQPPAESCFSLPVSRLISEGQPGQTPVPDEWRTLARENDWAVIIAPESDHILENAVDALSADVLLVNCHGKFLEQTSDKLATSLVCQAAGLPHPPTRLVSQATADWLAAVEREFETDRYVIKSRRGAGAESLCLVTQAEVTSLLGKGAIGSFAPGASLDELVVQPWISGQAYSRSAIVDRDGRWHWMPLMIQVLTAEPPKYVGGETASQQIQDRFPDDVLDGIVSTFSAGARGWVGVDCVFCDRDQRWVIIEVNPRCTTSLVGLSEAYSGNLASELLHSQLPGFSGLQGSWSPVRFSSDGTVGPCE